jgi:hypothetical protein
MIESAEVTYDLLYRFCRGEAVGDVI